MRRFLVKFCALFSIIWGLIAYCTFVVKPQVSGDIGKIGMIPFGNKYNASINEPFDLLEPCVNTTSDTVKQTSSVLTIGDSFSQLGKYGYSQFIAMKTKCVISNIARTEYFPEQEFIVLVNNHKISPGTIVIIESVERSFIGRLNNLDLSETNMSKPLPKENNEIDALNGALIWLRTALGMKQPIKKFHTENDLFSHEMRHNELYIYSSKWDGDGDILFGDLTDDYIKKAYENLYKLQEFAQNNEINLIYLVAADKYDVYEPFILEDHPKNPTLDSIPNEKWLINTKPLLQEAVYSGIKDVYYINDTHWSPIGSQIVGEEVAKRIKDLYLSQE